MLLSHNGITFTESQDGEHLEAHAPHFHRWLNHAADNDPTKMERIKAALFMILAGRHDWQLFIEVTGAVAVVRASSPESPPCWWVVTIWFPAIPEHLMRPEAEHSLSANAPVLPDQPKYIGDGSGIKAITGAT